MRQLAIAAAAAVVVVEEESGDDVNHGSSAYERKEV